MNQTGPTQTGPLGSSRLFRDHRLGVDSAVTLFLMVQALATDASVLVDVGCGRGAMVDPPAASGERSIQDLRAPGRRVIGIDIDRAGFENPVVDEFRMIEGGRWPLDDESVDLAYCDWVLEHVADPTAFVDELHRVLRPGGAFVARTVSKRSPLSLGARLVPNERHSAVVGQLQPGREEVDVFPTVYAMNTVPDLRAVLEPRFEWAASFHPGLSEYVRRFPRTAEAVAAIEARLPRRLQMVLIVSARKRG
ncbi:MAG: class I SAM-dependent methyltransferase [Jatrophihabitans sp.]|uniref:class I SAM-dependent methyltransferase n=1 Tax=Jatrophihabitans sp. TaxID=1932789 RepID=UPI003F80B19B